MQVPILLKDELQHRRFRLFVERHREWGPEIKPVQFWYTLLNTFQVRQAHWHKFCVKISHTNVVSQSRWSQVGASCPVFTRAQDSLCSKLWSCLLSPYQNLFRNKHRQRTKLGNTSIPWKWRRAQTGRRHSLPVYAFQLVQGEEN